MDSRRTTTILLQFLSAIVFIVSTLGLEIMNFPQPATIHEHQTMAMKIGDITAVAGSGTISSCDLASNPNGPFIATNQKSANYYVYYDATSDLIYNVVDFYELTITCYDNNNMNTSNSEKLFVYIVPNISPMIQNYPKDYGIVNAKTFQSSPVPVYTVIAQDIEGDTLTYTLTNQQPNTGLFSLDSRTGSITATRNLCSVTDISYILTITISDGKNTVDNFKVIVTIDNMNTPPAIRNLPSAVYIPENSPGGTPVFQLSVIDSTPPASSIVTTCNTLPVADSSKFQFNPTSSSITLSGTTVLDYESNKDIYIFTCSANDGCLPSGGSSRLTVYVTNIIEGLALNSTDYYCTLKECPVRQCSCYLPVSFTDYDGYSISQIGFDNNDFFYFQPGTNIVYTNTNYDWDTMLTSMDLILTAVDTGGFTATATVHITITDVNDNICQFNKNVSYTQADESTPLGVIDSFTVTDGDLAQPSKDVTVSVVSVSPPETKNYIDVSTTGDITYKSPIPSGNSGSSYTMIVSCRDGSFATVILSFTSLITTTSTTVSTPTTTTYTEKDLWDYDWFIVVFSLLIVCLVAGLVTAIAFLVYKFCFHQSAGTAVTPRNKVRPVLSANSGKESRSYLDDDGDSSRSRSSDSPWLTRQALSPRQLPALEY